MTSATQILSLTFKMRRAVNSQPQMGTHHANFVTTKKVEGNYPLYNTD